MVDSKKFVEYTFNNDLNEDIIIYDSFSPSPEDGDENTETYFGDLTKLGTVKAGQSTQIKSIHSPASVFVVFSNKDGKPLSRFVKLSFKKDDRTCSIAPEDSEAMDSTLKFIKFFFENPDNSVSKEFQKVISKTTASGNLRDAIDKVNSFFSNHEEYKKVNFQRYMMGLTYISQNVSGDSSATHNVSPDKSKYSLSVLVQLMGGTWPSAIPDITVSRFSYGTKNDVFFCWAEVDISGLPAETPDILQNFNSLFGPKKFLMSVSFNYGLSAGISGTRLAIIFETLNIPTGPSSSMKVLKPNVSIDINPIFQFVVFEVKGVVPFSIFGKKFDALATMTIDNEEAHVGVVVQGDHTSLPSPPGMKGIHYDQFGVGMGLFFHPPDCAIGVEGKYHIGPGNKNQIALDDNAFAVVCKVEDDIPNPIYASFYVPKMTLNEVLEIFTDTKTGIDIPIEFTDLSFIWSENPMQPVTLPDGTLAAMDSGFSARIKILNFDFYGSMRVNMAEGVTSTIQMSPISLKNVLTLSGDGKEITVKVDANGNQIKNNLIRNKVLLRRELAQAEDKTVMIAGGPVFQFKTLSSPFLSLKAKASLFEVVNREIEGSISKDGITFEIDFEKVLTEKMKCTLKNYDQFEGQFTFGINRRIKLPTVVGINLGSVSLNNSIKAHLELDVSRNDIVMKVGGNFNFEGIGKSFGDYKVDIHIARLSDLIINIGDYIEKNAKSIFSELFNDANRYLDLTKKAILTGGDDTARVLHDVYGKSQNEIENALKTLGHHGDTTLFHTDVPGGVHTDTHVDSGKAHVDQGFGALGHFDQGKTIANNHVDTTVPPHIDQPIHTDVN